MPSKSPSGAAKRNHKKLRAALAIDTRQSVPQEAITGLPNHLVVTHILRSDYFDDPADLARLTAVSHAMRDAVTATGLRFEELDEMRASQLGCLSALLRLQLAGRLSCQERLCQAAARSGQLEELKVLRENSCPWDEHTCSRAALSGHLEVLQWARANGCPWDSETCHNAAFGGHLEVLQWARANGCPWDSETCHNAAFGGHLEVLQWARANGCPWNSGTCMAAAESGHLEVLQWLHANGCRWDEKGLLFISAREGQEAVMQALIEAGADINKAYDDGVTPLLIAAHEGHVAMVRALIEVGADVNTAMDEREGVTPLYIAAHKDHAAIVQILRDAGVA